jgi:uncharacterized membrane protein YfcA
MYIYLPIAEISVNIFFIIFVGFLGGCISGFFGISGSFIGVPILVTYGIESTSAVASFTNQMLTMSFIGFKDDLEEKRINFQVVKISFAGAISGVIIGIFLFKKLTNIGYIDIVISFLYIFILGSISLFMFSEGLAFFKEKYFPISKEDHENNEKNKNQNLEKKKRDLIKKIDIFPYKIQINNNVEISVFLMSIFSFLAGILVSIGGVASGLIMIPVMTYVYKMQIRNAMATSNLNGGLIVIFSNILQILTIKKTDLILTTLLLIGAVIGIIFSKKFADRASPESLRLGLAVLMMFIVLRMIFGITLTPKDLFVITTIK